MKKLFAIILSLGLIMTPVPGVNTAKAASAAGYLEVLTGMAMGVLGSTILMKCKLGTTQPSIMVFFTGGLTYLIAEITSGEKIGSDTKKNAQELDRIKATMKEGGDYQLAAIDAQIQKEKDLASHANTKSIFMFAAAVQFLLASILAYTELPKVPFGLDIAGCTPEPGSTTAATQLIVTAYTLAVGYGAGGGMGALMGGAMAAAGFIFEPVAHAYTQSANWLYTTLLNSAPARIKTFLAFSGVVFALFGLLQNEKKNAEKRIGELQLVRAQFVQEGGKVNPGATTSGAGPGGTLRTLPGGQNVATIRALPIGNQSGRRCISGGTSANSPLTISEAACRNPLQLTRPNLEGRFGEIPALRSSVSTTFDLNQALANGDLSRAEIEAGKLANQASALRKLSDSELKKYNDSLMKEGKPIIDVNKGIDQFVSSMNDQVNKRSPGAGKLTSSMFNPSSAGSASLSAKDLAKSDLDANKDANANAIVGAGGIAAGANSGMSDDAAVEDEAGSLGGADPNALAALSKELNANSLNEGEIASDSGISIFKQVSNRYFLNYTKLFNRKKIDPPLSPTEPPPAP